MPVTYSADVATTQNTISVFFKLLFRWKGSVYRLIWRDLLWFSLLYTSLSLLYRLILSEDARKDFEHLVKHVHAMEKAIPMTFILSFFVSNIVKHRQDAFNNIPNIDNLATSISMALKGDGEALRLRKQLVRYANLAFALTMSSISPQMKKRLPTLKHFIEAGLLSESESKTIEELAKQKRPTHWVPIVWSANLLSKASEQGLLANDKVIFEVMRELNKLKINCENLMNYDTLTIPLVYTQVVTLAVYGYGVTTAIGQQFLDPSEDVSKEQCKDPCKQKDNSNLDYYVPVFTLLQFIFYFGWLRVAETMMNCMGEDDDDFDINAIFDRNCEVTKYIITDMHAVCPRKTEDDPYFEEELPPFPIPYTVAAMDLMSRCNTGSFQNYVVNPRKRDFLIRRRRGDQVDVEVQVYNFEMEGQQKKLCSPCCSCCFKTDIDDLPEEMEAVSVDELEKMRKKLRLRLRRNKASSAEDDNSAS